MDGVVVLGVENDRLGVLGVEDFGVENDRLPEDELGFGLEKDRLFAAAKAGATEMPSTKTMVTTRASTRRTQAQGRMVPLPSAFGITRAEFQLVERFFLPGFRFRRE